ncbi:hypothetical protein NPIL_411181 [Nephila pilipes]|uniref:Uncharacterized protein n=1 Tax=Nephila pilipes TaxID=299642 RepID=A0A8X6J9M0_NEPPI|nr:hypothetical protein NPIL_411181 [Nephila pilipes]
MSPDRGSQEEKGAARVALECQNIMQLQRMPGCNPAHAEERKGGWVFYFGLFESQSVFRRWHQVGSAPEFSTTPTEKDLTSNFSPLSFSLFISYFSFVLPTLTKRSSCLQYSRRALHWD